MVDDLFKSINSAFNDEINLFSVASKRAAVLNLLLYVYINHSSTQNTRSIKNLKSYEAILNAVEYISTHFSEKLTLDEICYNSGYSKYHFSRIFKEYTGYTVMNYLAAVRCDNARHLLKENIPISKICYECGFENCSLFAKEFKRHFQLLPSEYRKIKQKRT